MSRLTDRIQESLNIGLLNKNAIGYGNFKPELIKNDESNNETVLETLTGELDRCKSFIFSVAFITESGLTTLKANLLDLKNRGIKGRIITSTYLHFNQPKIFKELLKITNVEVRLTDIKGFHSKGYIFEHEGYYSLLVGSSNLTAGALKVNHEWNIKLTSHENGEIIYHFKNQFEEVWEKSNILTNEWIDKYETNYVMPMGNTLTDQIIDFPADYNINSIVDSYKIKPNKMQAAALDSLSDIRDAGNKKSLVVSATGTGKTYLSAFDVRKYKPKRFLFIAHREQILLKAKEEYMKLLGGVDSEFGILSGTRKETDTKYLFATIQTISNDNVLKSFSPSEFDYILIDEVHKAGAPSYQKVIDYFKPDFLLGMTATPERTDDFNIFKLFDYNIAYEIRLQEALEEDMLCPFHYFGVTDFEYQDELIDDTTVLSKLIEEERVNHIIEKVNYYGHSGDQVKGLMFCSGKEEAKLLSEAFNLKGLKTVALTGENKQSEREYYVNLLEEGELDYILTVDIFNEGIDIPKVNQIVMLRQTQSSIIFIQQLGRGLRKHQTKKFVTVIDFIGNYKNNYLIPIALSGDQSQNKNNIRRRAKDTSYIKGISTINFEEIARKRIFDSINKNNLTSLNILRDAYINLKNKIGRIPRLIDFIHYNSIDPVVLIEKHSNYYVFLQKMNEEVTTISSYEMKLLSMLSIEIMNGKRLHELILFKLLLENDNVSLGQFLDELTLHNCPVDTETIDSINRIFDLSFFTSTDQNKYGNTPLITFNTKIDQYTFNDKLKLILQTSNVFKEFVLDIIQTGFLKANKYVTNEKMTLFERYTRKDVCRLLNWHTDQKGTMFGYKTSFNTTPIFVTYHKKEVEKSIDYHDTFLTSQILQWQTKNNRSLNSPEVKKITDGHKVGNEIHILVQKSKEEGIEFYYLGKANVDQNTIEESRTTNTQNKEVPIVNIDLILETPVEPATYKYIINE